MGNGTPDYLVGMYSWVHDSVKRGVGIDIGRFCIIEKDVVIGNHVKISDYVKIPEGAQIGDGVVIGSYARLGKRCVIGDNVSIKWIFVFFMNPKRLIIEDMGIANRNCFDFCLPCMDYDILKAYWNLQLADINFYCHLPEGNLADKNL